MALLMVFPINALMCIKKKIKLINHDCLPVLMVLYVMLYIELAYLLLYIVLSFVLSFRLIPKKLMSSYTGMEECQKTNTTTKIKM